MRRLVAALLLVWLSVLPAHAAIAVVAHTVAATAANDGITTSAINTTGATLLIACDTSYQAATAPTLTDSKSNSWTALTARASTGQGRVTCYYTIPSSVGSGHTFTLSDTDAFPSIEVIAFSGTAAASVLDQQSGANDAPVGATTAQPGALTPAADNSLVIAATAWTGDGGTETINSSFTTDATFQVAFVGSVVIGGAVAYQIQTTATTRNPTWTYGSSSAGGNLLAVFKVSAGGGATPTSGLTLLGAGGP